MKPYPPEIRTRALDLAREIGIKPAARRLGIPYHTVYRWIRPDYAARYLTSARDLKRRYAGQCRVCGRPTNGSNGPGTASDLCWHCFSGEHLLIWTREAIIAAVQAWVAQYGRPPSAADWRWSGREWPTVNSLQRQFGSWSKGIQAAGYEPSRGGAPAHRL